MQSGLVLIFDECDVLGLNQALLQQFRNVFMKVPNCMVVIAATPDLFPAISAAYSPIIRQFKSIEVGALESFQDVHRCIMQRLARTARSLGIEDEDHGKCAAQVARWADPSDRFTFVYEIQEASGGLPHQIQLLCHLAFRRLQRGESSRLALSIEVLEETTREIGLTDTAEARPLHRAISDLNEDLRNGLHYLARCSGKATLEQLALVARIADPNCDWSDEAANRRLERLLDVGLLRKDDDGAIEFAGDSLDRVYGRLFARLRNERLNIGSSSLESHFSDTIEDRVREACGSSALLWSDSIAPSKLPSVREILTTAAEEGWENVEMKADAFGALRSLAYEGPRSIADVNSFRVVTAHASCRWCESCLLLVQHSETFDDGAEPWTAAGDAVRSLNELEEHIFAETGQPCSIQLADVPALPGAMWRSYVVEFGSPRERELLAGEIAAAGVEAYVAGDATSALSLFEKSLDVIVTADCLNNRGYLQFAIGDMEAARSTYREAAEIDPMDSLIAYNYALTFACEKDWDAADEQAERATQLDEKVVVTMQIPVLVEGELTTIEQSEDPPGPVEASRQLRALIKEIRSSDC